MYFEKTLSEIEAIVERINDELWPDGGQFDTGLSFEFNGWFGIFKFNDILLIHTENSEGWEYNKEMDNFEDIEICIRRLIKKLYSSEMAQLVKIL
jgi:hypothetical protein